MARVSLRWIRGKGKAVKKTEKKSLQRREFLKAASIAGVASGVAAVSLKGKPAKAAKLSSDGHAGYRETDHVKKYYELARF